MGSFWKAGNIDGHRMRFPSGKSASLTAGLSTFEVLMRPFRLVAVPTLLSLVAVTPSSAQKPLIS